MTFAIFATSLAGFVITILTAMSFDRLNALGVVIFFSSLFGLAYSVATAFGFS